MTSLSDFSVFLGYASICCWLGAQFPQVIENIRRKSCEGLALPFLANWLLGDISNLIGCVLTHQLPFQTWLAVYFVTVDMMLCGQYVYYQRVNPPRSRSRITRRMSVDRPSPRYRTLSAVASNVAAAAALAAQHDEHTAPRRASRWPQSSRETFFDSSASRVSREDADGDDVDEGAFSALADSFHSEGVSWSTERHGRRRGNSVGRYPALTRSAFLPPTSHIESNVDSLARGRSLQRDPERVHLDTGLPSVSRNSRINKQGASMVFLGVFALFGLGSFGSLKHVSTFTGRVLAPRALDSSLDEFTSVEHTAPSLFIDEITSDHTLISIPPTIDFEPKVVNSDDQERIIGRIFAWVCTTLYLTSRLPQIWKNFVRKSVEGLSMYLFIFAFLGNVFYVASILTSAEVFQPAPASSEFIKESIPYILGSGGTLVFDLTIVIQSFVYRPKPHRRHRSRSRTVADEEGGLIAGDVLAQEAAVVHSRTRTASSTRA
ncbi:hypothetical protein BT96DRAFT_962232 [Gymnopus androsaceus JB14]|uniref:PQ-loop-domain-containing protein n=1 Tax=Gymnopus androsaceus JB14 TaxID=1447944 RepID=A0A6A4IIY0_9AGAR|nr:hypothetical protein BT96DRAFT_962232 [Gymnopus androsaceus JB14]